MSENSIGPYNIVRLIKSGGQGQVYLGYDRRLRRQVAIKIHTLPESRVGRKLALAEAQKASQINCPHVVQIYDLIESDEHLAIVMEYVPGCDLEELLQQRRLSLASILTVATDLACALAAARQQKVVHGDLKAANVLVTGQGRVKLTDFGIAKASNSAELSPAGSQSALTPEHVMGEPLDVRADLFALGCLLFRMLSQEQPFFRAGRLDVQLLMARERPSLAGRLTAQEEVPAELVTLVEQLLHKDANDRPLNTHAVRRCLRNAQQHLPLADCDNLLVEARFCFRPESPEDIPLGIPAQLRDRGRSTLKRSRLLGLARRWRSWRTSTRIMLGTAALAGLGIPIALAVQDYPTRVHFEAPVLQLAQHSEIPRQISHQWLMDQVYAASEAQIGAMHVSGAVSPRAYYADLAGEEPELVVNASLRCSAALCLYAVSREQGGQFDYRQATIAPDLPEAVWATIIQQSTRSLLR